MREEYTRQLELLHNELTQMGALIESAIANAVKALDGDEHAVNKAYDYEKDIKRGDFNPLKRYGESMEDITRRTSECINLTLGAMSDAYVHLDIKRFKAILDNIVYIGLKSNFCNIVNSKIGKGKCTNERPL